MIGDLSQWFIFTFSSPLTARRRRLRLGQMGRETERATVETYRKIDREIRGALRKKRDVQKR